jgi:hypothetical protein
MIVYIVSDTTYRIDMLKLILLAAAVLGLAAPALAQQSRSNTSGVMRYDTNKDGAVDRDEWNAGQEARFKRLDTNSDGKLSQDELFARTRPPATASCRATVRPAASRATSSVSTRTRMVS